MFLSCYSVCSFVRFPVDIIPLVESANKLSQTALNFFADSQHRRAACILPLSLSAGADFQGTNFYRLYLAFFLHLWYNYYCKRNRTYVYLLIIFDYTHKSQYVGYRGMHIPKRTVYLPLLDVYELSTMYN